jgi:hypothetical protein
MNWEAISTIAEIVGATAVVVSLIYLAAQIRQNNRQVEEQIRALRLQAYDTAGADFSTLRLHVSGNPQRASVWRRAKDSYSALEPDEKSQANEISRMHGGAEDEVLRKIVDKNLGYWLDNPGFREWWRTERKTPYTDEFEALVQKVCSRIEKEDS